MKIFNLRIVTSSAIKDLISQIHDVEVEVQTLQRELASLKKLILDLEK